MKRDRGRIERSLTSALRLAREQRFGDCRTRRSVPHWDWNGHSFLFSYVEAEYE